MGTRGRYLSISLMLIVVMCVGAFLTVVLLGKIRRRSGLINAAALALLVLVAVTRFGPPSMSEMRAALDRTCGKYSGDIVRSGCTHFAGNYWKVWPAVFHANLLLREQGLNRRVWGISERGESSRANWTAQGRSSYLIGAAADDAEGRWAMEKAGIAAGEAGRQGAIQLFTCTPPCSMYAQPYHFGTRGFISRLGEISPAPNVLAACLKDRGAEGPMLAGPYIFLTQGRYRFEMSGTATDVDWKAKRYARLQIGRLGYGPVFEKEIGPKDLTGGSYTVSGEFFVDRDSPNWEFEVYYWPSSNFRIHDLGLARIGSK